MNQILLSTKPISYNLNGSQNNACNYSQDTLHFTGRRSRKAISYTIATVDVAFDATLIALQWKSLSQGYIDMDTWVHIGAVLNSIGAALFGFRMGKK